MVDLTEAKAVLSELERTAAALDDLLSLDPESSVAERLDTAAAARAQLDAAQQCVRSTTLIRPAGPAWSGYPQTARGVAA